MDGEAREDMDVAAAAGPSDPKGREGRRELSAR
jgi:hypothetical protein